MGKNERCVHESVVLENLDGVEIEDDKDDDESDIDLSADEKEEEENNDDNAKSDDKTKNDDNDNNSGNDKKDEKPATKEKSDFEFPETSLTAPEITSKSSSRKHKKSVNIDSEEEYAPVGKPNIQKVRSLPAWKQ